MRRFVLAFLLAGLVGGCVTHYRVPKPSDMPEPSIGKRTWEQPKVTP